MARSTFYYYLRQLQKPDKSTTITAAIKDIYHQHKGRYGYRRITMTLK
ncbi:IS3 family transposase, partial [Chitinophaga sp. Hz27]